MSLQNHSSIGEILLYQTQDGNARVDVLLRDDTVWLTQSQISKLFDKDRTVISKHIQSILKQEELESSVCANFAHTASDGKNYETNFYIFTYLILQ